MSIAQAHPVLRTIEDFVRLRITRKIAEGGMGAVYEAQQVGAQGFEKTVAIKILLEKLNKPQYADLFIAEAKLVANLVHENIVQIYQLGQTPSVYYFVMEYVNGISLGNFINAHRLRRLTIPDPLAVFIVSRIARGLAYAHKATDTQGKPLEIVHRDVCPNNILVTTEGLPKLADFGVAKVAQRALLGDELIVGKRLYMAPEQATHSKVDFRADIFSLGAVLFELLTLKPLRRPDKPTTLQFAKVIIEGDIPWKLLPDTVSKDLLNILHHMLALNPDKRYQETSKLARDLEYYIYKDGYGPTIQTLEAYMREYFAYLYDPTLRNGQAHHTDKASTLPQHTVEKTLPDAELTAE